LNDKKNTSIRQKDGLINSSIADFFIKTERKASNSSQLIIDNLDNAISNLSKSIKQFDVNEEKTSNLNKNFKRNNSELNPITFKKQESNKTSRFKLK
jgi:hypothetical protein